jgi:hypothetical protein
LERLARLKHEKKRRQSSLRFALLLKKHPMRTTVSLSDTALQTARRCATARQVNLGQAVSDLIEQADRQRLAMKDVNGVWVADLPPTAKPIASRDVEDLLSDG